MSFQEERRRLIRHQGILFAIFTSTVILVTLLVSFVIFSGPAGYLGGRYAANIRQEAFEQGKEPFLEDRNWQPSMSTSTAQTLTLGLRHEGNHSSAIPTTPPFPISRFGPANNTHCTHTTPCTCHLRTGMAIATGTMPTGLNLGLVPFETPAKEQVSGITATVSEFHPTPVISASASPKFAEIYDRNDKSLASPDDCVESEFDNKRGGGRHARGIRGPKLTSDGGKRLAAEIGMVVAVFLVAIILIYG